MILTDRYPLLSIIVPVYGTEQYLEKCLDSALNCTYKNIEVIVVDDKSPGNVQEIITKYQNEDKRVKLVRHEVNKGLFRARITGVENSKGDYIAFLDSDDHVSCDFYRRLIERALEKNSDMVIGEYYLEFADNQYQYQNLSHTRVMDIDLKGREIAKLLFAQEGKDYSLHVVWNKIYRRDLWDKCYSYFCEFDSKFGHTIMCEDVLYSSFYYYYAGNMSSIHNDFYYYYAGNNDASTRNYNYEKVYKNIQDIKNIFSFIRDMFSSELKETGFINHIDNWYLLLKKVWKDIIDRNFVGKERNILYCALEIEQNTKFNKSLSDNYFYQIYTNVTKIETEEIKTKILDDDIEVISFDIFDTLIVRPFYEATDLFYLLDIYANNILGITDKIDFKQLRIDAESLARQKTKAEDVTLDEIYYALKELVAFDEKALNIIKAKEVELEIKYCRQRCFAKELFDLAKYLGKKVILTSDMYLSEDVIISILKNNGYNDYDKLYLSNVVGVTKHTGNIFKYIIKELDIKPDKILHIGDNYYSDVQQAKDNGLQSYHLPKTTALLMNEVGEFYGGEAYRNVYKKQFLLRRSDGMLSGYFGLRTMLGVIANKIFDNPFQNINNNTDFNADPRFIGYGTFGMHMFAVAKWLLDDAKKYNYKNLNFFARDGYIPMEAVKILNKLLGLDVNINYLPFTRTSIIPLQINNKADILNFYGMNMFVFNKTPKYFIEMFKDYLYKDFYENARKSADKDGIKYEECFRNISEFSKFNDWFFPKIDIQKLQKYKEDFGKCFQKCFNGKTANFDIGYSCRIDYALKKAFDYDISSYFIHINSDIALYRAHAANIEINTFYQYSPGITGTLREYLLSAIEPSCKKVKIKGDEYELVYKDYEDDYLLKFSVGNIQNAALDFVHDMVQIFGNDLNYLYYQRDDISMMNEYFNAQAKAADRILFSALKFEDDIGAVGNTDFLNLWGGSMNAATFNYIRPLWKQAIVLFFVDRALLKSRAKRYLAGKPKQLKALTIIYKSGRWVYHKFFARWIKI